MTMETTSESDSCPPFSKCHLTMVAWHNGVGTSVAPLIAPCFLEKIDRAFAVCRDLALRTSFPVFGEDYRIFGGYAMMMDLRWLDAVGKLEYAQKVLQTRWSEVLSEAEGRLGEKFTPNLFPDPTSIVGLWKVEIKFSEKDTLAAVTTRGLLGKFSRFHKPDL